MKDIVLYLKCKENVEIQKKDVLLKDVATIECEEKNICNKCKELHVYHFEEENKRAVISALKIIQLICKEYPEVLVQSIGETDTLIEQVKVGAYKGWKQWTRVIVVCLITFFGTAFTIIAYNNDAGVVDIFEKVYLAVLNEKPPGVDVLEISYAIGLAAGIIIFFNHIGGRRITKDPTPIEVSMRNYERDVNQTLIETADREGLEEDV